MTCVVNWIPLRICVHSRNTQPHLKLCLPRIFFLGARQARWWGRRNATNKPQPNLKKMRCNAGTQDPPLGGRVDVLWSLRGSVGVR